MTERGNRATRTSLCLLAALVLSCATSGIGRGHAFPQPQPESESLSPGLFFGNPTDEETIMLVNRMKQLIEQKHRVVEQENEITDEQIEIQAILEAKAREQERTMSIEQPPPDYSEESQPEALPVPEAMIHDQQQHPKRHGVNTVSYMSLCHFKICNMGRKRQSK